MSKTIKFRTECIQKHADLLLMEVLKYYNIPIRTSNERVLTMNRGIGVCRELVLSYEKTSNVADKGALYSVNIRLSECIAANFVKFDYANGNSLYNLYIEEFTVRINGKRANAGYKLLKELNDIVLSKIDKPFNLGKPTLICEGNETWDLPVVLSPIYGTRLEKHSTLEKIVQSFMPYISEKVVEYIKDNIDDEREVDVKYISIDVIYNDKPGMFEPLAYIDASFDIGGYECSVDINFSSMHSSSTKKVDWLYADEINILIDGHSIFEVDQNDDKQKDILFKHKEEVLNLLNHTTSKTAKKLYKQAITA